MGQWLELLVEPSQGGQRLDQLLSTHFHQLSRAGWQKQIKSSFVLVDNQPVRSSHRVSPGEQVMAKLPDLAQTSLIKPDTKIQVLYQDDDVIVLNKPAGLIVHPSLTNTSPSVAAYFRSMIDDADEERPGVVHRLDKDTSGVMILARHQLAKKYLLNQFKNHLVGKSYLTLVWGHLKKPQATIDLPIGRHTVRRTSMKVTSSGKSALSHYQVEREYDRVSLVRVKIETGRTHQIRVHFAHLGHPVVGDRTYGRRPMPVGLHRQFLHAEEISLQLPGGQKMTFTAPLANDLEDYLSRL